MVVVVVCAQINENILTNNFFPAFSGSASSADGPAEGVHPLIHVVDASVTSPLAFVHAESLIILGSRLDDHVLVVDDFGVVVVLVAVSSSFVITSSIGDVAPLLLLTAQASLSAFSLSCFSINCLRCCKKKSYSLVKLSNLEMYNPG